MARFSLLASAALATIALTAPAQAQNAGPNAPVELAAADDNGGRGEGRRGGWRGRESGGGMQPAPERSWRAEQRDQSFGGNAPQPQARPEWRQQREQARSEVQQRQRGPEMVQDAPQRRNAPEGGWRSQRPDQGQRYGRNWNGGGEVSRPAPAQRGATPAVPDRGVTDMSRAERWGAQNAGRNRSYADPNRNRGYRDGWRDGRRSDDSGDRAERREAYREGYRNGRTADSYRDRRDQRHGYYNGQHGGQNWGTRDWSRNRYSSDHHRWNRHDWRRDRRYDWHGYRSFNRNVYRLGRYSAPYRNWSYSRLSIGFFLQPLFYSQSYWIDDPWRYRLPEAYGPYRWVRYYDDALLVDIYSGEVVDVIHDFFW